MISLSDDLVLNYHIMHPGGASEPADPNGALFYKNKYHLHYILQHDYRLRDNSKKSYSFIHITSDNLINWHWEKTTLQPSFTGHGMFSGTGFFTKSGIPAIIYHGEATGNNFIVTANDNELNSWNPPLAVQVATLPDGHHDRWDPDCFIIGDHYYSISSGREQKLFRSSDLYDWQYVGNFLANETADVVYGEDISCPNFFKLGGKWILLCISHSFGCRYYIGDWDFSSEQFVPTHHYRLNWPAPDADLVSTTNRDFFAPESLVTPDNRRVMWAWLRDKSIRSLSIQSLPRELSLLNSTQLAFNPLKELQSLRFANQLFSNITIIPEPANHSGYDIYKVTEIDCDSFEISLSINSDQFYRKRFGIFLFGSDRSSGLQILFSRESGCIHLGKKIIPFNYDLVVNKSIFDLRIFADKYLIEVFFDEYLFGSVVYFDYVRGNEFLVYAYGNKLNINAIEFWKLRKCNQGFLAAKENLIWQPDILT
jgi:beta-fructofuranosidase